MTKPLTFRRNGTWGIEGVDLSTLPPKVYGALAKLRDLEHPLCGTRADMLRSASDEEMARFFDESIACPPDDKQCLGRGEGCIKCWLDWLKEPADKFKEQSTDQKCRSADQRYWQSWLRYRFERREG